MGIIKCAHGPENLVWFSQEAKGVTWTNMKFARDPENLHWHRKPRVTSTNNKFAHDPENLRCFAQKAQGYSNPWAFWEPTQVFPSSKLFQEWVNDIPLTIRRLLNCCSIVYVIVETKCWSCLTRAYSMCSTCRQNVSRDELTPYVAHVDRIIQCARTVAFRHHLECIVLVRKWSIL